ncbi:MarR family winged helix-turn-helix transcriptional regulator [Bordetella avium]|uniref:MarR-family transcriptional regulator n=1 Tax=Bordetella avium (strain 197N) TaxID=360910 RepID=Q2KUC1_BORA1|nr:MarR family transcriptional regulator [Bordetella avium]AZY50462.1 MarR family transcriptional regulator [Bordetella avium]AZY53859.1 MarR family transcriptional regulator [Bordetella avium]RIQ15368.1 MarR family transcriptional regulator [Bordetella avium]RIQ19827.1 MarR family transcriptional regulator [Bordetella avium]RIQ34406.1 MarR family transcriptional regulator [Bordetella avium]
MPKNAAPEDLPALDRFLTYRLHLVNKISDRDSAQAYADRFKLPIGEARCLAAIGRFAPLSVNDLARAANLNKGQASRCAQALQEAGFIRKTVSSEDGRGVVLNLTAKGQRRYPQVVALIAERNEEVFGCLSAREQADLSRIFDKIIAHLQPET